MVAFPEGKEIFNLFFANCAWWNGREKTPELIRQIKEEFASRTSHATIEPFVYFHGENFDVPELMWFDDQDSPMVKFFYCKFLTRFCDDSFERLIESGQVVPLQIVKTANWLNSPEYQEVAAKFPNNYYTVARFLSKLVEYCEIPSHKDELVSTLKNILLPHLMLGKSFWPGTSDFSITEEKIYGIINKCREKADGNPETMSEINEAIASLYSEYEMDTHEDWNLLFDKLVRMNKKFKVAIIPRRENCLIVDFELLFDFIVKSDITVNDPRYNQIINRYRKEAELARERKQSELAKYLEQVVERLEGMKAQHAIVQPKNIAK